MLERLKNECLFFDDLLFNIDNIEQSKLVSEIFPELLEMKNVELEGDTHPEGDLLSHVKLCINVLRKEFNIITNKLLVSVLLHDIGKLNTFKVFQNGNRTFFTHEESSVNIAKRTLSSKFIYFNEKDISDICFCIANHTKIFRWYEFSSSSKYKLMQNENFQSLIDLHYCNVIGRGDIHRGGYRSFKTMEEDYSNYIKNTKQKENISNLIINGEDLINLGFKPGRIFNTIFKDVSKNCIDMSKVDVLKYVNTNYKKEE
jgi:hypothetical protein